MAISQLKIYFGGLIRKYLKSANVRQIDLADALNLSPSAVSQMLSGKMTPNIGQLDIIMSKLALDRNACAELRDCLARIRSGDVELRSPLNEFIKNERTRRGLSVTQLSEQTGIDEDTLYTLENRVSVQPLPHEAVRLAAVLGCELRDLWQFPPQNPVSEINPGRSSGAIVMRDKASEYRSNGGVAVKMPVIEFEVLKNFRGEKEHLLDVAWRHMTGVVEGRIPGLVQVKTRGAEFGWTDFYEVILEVAEISQWLPGATVMGSVAGELVLGSAAEQRNFIRLPGCEKAVQCSWFLLVNSFRFTSDLFMALNHKEVKENKSIAAVFRTVKKDNPPE